MVVAGVVFTVFTPNASQAQWGQILAIPDLAERTGEYLGLVESLDSKLDRLLVADFKAGCEFLEQAKRSQNSEERKILFRQAQEAFTKSAVLAEGSAEGTLTLRRAISRVGIWNCCLALEDESNARRALEKVLEIPTKPSLKTTMEASFRRQFKIPKPPKAVPLKFWRPSEWKKLSEENWEELQRKLTKGPFDEEIEVSDPERMDFLSLYSDVLTFLIGTSPDQFLPTINLPNMSFQVGDAGLVGSIYLLASAVVRSQEGDSAFLTKLIKIDDKTNLVVEAQFQYSYEGESLRNVWEFEFSIDPDSSLIARLQKIRSLLIPPLVALSGGQNY